MDIQELEKRRLKELKKEEAKKVEATKIRPPIKGIHHSTRSRSESNEPDDEEFLDDSYWFQ